MSGFDWYSESQSEIVEQPGAPPVFVRAAKLGDDSIRGRLMGSDESQRAAIISSCCYDAAGNRIWTYEQALLLDAKKSGPLMAAFYRVNGLSDDDVQASEKK